MKTTLVLSDHLVKRLKEEGRRAGQTMSQITEAALRRYLAGKDTSTEFAALPVVSGGEPLVDLADRDALAGAMDQE